jgi:hypothetical protein
MAAMGLADVVEGETVAAAAIAVDEATMISTLVTVSERPSTGSVAVMLA